VAAGARTAFVNGEAPAASTGFAPTYFPGTVNQSEAARISCAVGQEVRLNDFALITVPTISIAGTLRDSSGKAPAGGVLMLYPRASSRAATTGGAPAALAAVQPDGAFSIGEVVPGEYTLRAQRNTSTSTSTEVAIVPLLLTRSTTGVAVTTAKPGAVSGRVVPDTGLAFTMPMAQIAVTAWPQAPDAARLAFWPDRVKDDGTFEILGLDGAWALRASAPGWYLKAVRLNGTDVTDGPLSFRANTDVAGFEVVLTNRATTLSGTVQDDRGATLHDYAVLVFAADKAKWHWNSRFQQMARPDQEGRFKLQSVTPGEYLVVAVREAEPEEWTDPESLERLRERATRVTLAEGDARTVQLSLVTDEKR
jgi:hypothetical protein